MRDTAIIGSPINSSALPVLRISPTGKILYANSPATGLLKEWNCMAHDRLPDSLLSSYPELTRISADQLLDIPLADGTSRFAVIGFPTAGYIGIYALTMPGKKPVLNRLETANL